MVIEGKFKQCFSACIVSAALLAGCAQQPVGTSAPPPASPIKSGVEKPADTNARVAAKVESKVDYINMNPVPIMFDKMSVKLRDEDKSILAQISERAKKAQKLTITGFCDRRQVGNAKLAALTRATAVKNELITLGVNPKTVQVKYVTEAPDKHAAEIHF
jgi:outer membrane protein OmpA-like peptidoglycan-associated protein